MPEPQPAAHPSTSLPETATRMLDFEREWTRHIGAKEEAISTQFRVSSARYYQILNALIDTPAAVRYDPMLVSRLRRTRDARTHKQSLRKSRHHDQEATD